MCRNCCFDLSVMASGAHPAAESPSPLFEYHELARRAHKSGNPGQRDSTG